MLHFLFCWVRIPAKKLTRRGGAWLGMARRGQARRGEARHGMDSFKKKMFFQSLKSKEEPRSRGMARQGWAWLGKARHGFKSCVPLAQKTKKNAKKNEARRS